MQINFVCRLYFCVLLLVCRFDSCQRALKTLRQEHDSLVEMDEMLKRHSETLRQQLEKYVIEVSLSYNSSLSECLNVFLLNIYCIH